MYKVVRGIKFGLIFRSTFFFQNCFKTERLEWIAQPTVELAHKFHPENVKCIQLKKKKHSLLYQCKRKVCKNADSPSMTTRIAMVKAAQAANNAHVVIAPT
jgi:hypothetical protein